MNIDHVTITATDPDAVGRWYAEVLGLPVERGAEDVEVTIGRSVLALRPGLAPSPGRAHHLAFSVPPNRFDEAVAWIGERAELITEEGTGVLSGPPEWNSRSVYFWGPDGADLELIARNDLAAEHDRGGDGAFGPADLLDVNEAALAVPDVPAARRAITDGLGLVPFVPVTDVFSPIGDQHGLLILIHEDRVILPTSATRLLRAPVEVRLRGPREATVEPTPESRIVATAGGAPYLGPGSGSGSGDAAPA